MAGYSQTPLAKKLGFKEGHVAVVFNAPDGFVPSLEPLPDAVTLVDDLSAAPRYDIIVFFTTVADELRSRFPGLARKLQPAGGFWIAWPKKTSGMTTDVTENIVREIGLQVGLVDNKVCAIDEIWSGLRFVIRVKDRPKKTRA